MSKRSAILIIVLVLIVGTGLLYFLLGGKSPSGMPIFTGSPFGTPPDDTGTGTTGGTGSTPTGTGVGSDGRPLPRFLRLSDAPVAGAVSFLKNGLTVVRYVDRATGHVYEVNPATLEKTKVLNVTSPRVYTALFRADGSGFISRTVAEGDEVISNTSTTLIPPKATSASTSSPQATDPLYTAQSTLLRGNVGEFAVLPDGNIVYNLTDTGAVTLSNFAGGSPRALLTLPFTEWLIHPINSASALLVTKASEAAQGYAYTLSTANGRLTKVLGPLMGLTALPSPDGRRVAYSHVSGTTNVFSSLNITSSATISILPATLTEKCVWGREVSSIIVCGVPDGGLGLDAPDSWYQGLTAYNDRVWRFNTDTDTAEILLEPEKDFNTTIDVVHPMLSPSEDYFIFTNKNDLSLWALKID